MNGSMSGEHRESRGAAAWVLGAGFAEHDTPFVQNVQQGLDCYLFRLQLDGHAVVTTSGASMVVEAGDLLLFPAGEPYELRIEPDDGDRPGEHLSTDLYLFCGGPWIEQWWRDRPRKRHLRLALHENCVYLWRQLIEEHRRPGKPDEELCDYLLRALCLTFDKYGYDPKRATPVPIAAERIRAYIERHAAEDLSLSDIAAAVGLSVSRVVHIFKEAYGQTVVQYLQSVRLQMACDRMRFSTLNLEEIADRCGFHSYSYFYRVFRQKYGISPREFRQRAT
ncbi:AraC family transcriptional regulator, arabinose operon regulatory protein [Alicyclobacillus vulcanalis]|uniref:AraC family transcriptional regulator, arabinose operon regulatory protein n=2 Tax=Alicyclobacillus vulcanalis TaxID=252246 RepID=A0A1N7K7G5_9BACL|nr:AraC family transcriptional regulator, arabinose operon regulatory protein [Alicyclobacillus vulcanalis]